MSRNTALLEEKIGYEFRDKALLDTALTHSSYANELRAKGENIMYNERLEFLGDSVLSLVASVYLFKGNRKMFEGDLTKVRAGIVCENALYDYACEIELGEYLYLGNGEEANGGRTRRSILADAFEAVIAAIYLDSGNLDEVRRFVLDFIRKAATQQYNSCLFVAT